jgi:hypothetical protein
MFTQGWAVKGLVAVGLRASNLLVTAGPGVAGLGPIPTLLTGMYAVAGLRHVRVFSSEIHANQKLPFTGILGSIHQQLPVPYEHLPSSDRV